MDKNVNNKFMQKTTIKPALTVFYWASIRKFKYCAFHIAYCIFNIVHFTDLLF